MTTRILYYETEHVRGVNILDRNFHGDESTFGNRDSSLERTKHPELPERWHVSSSPMYAWPTADPEWDPEMEVLFIDPIRLFCIGTSSDQIEEALRWLRHATTPSIPLIDRKPESAYLNWCAMLRLEHES
jgi:hypothetical protein